MKMTSAYANKMLKKLGEDKQYWLDKESRSFIYVASLDEEPVIPAYDFEEVSARLAEIDEQVCRIKHAINMANAAGILTVGGQPMSVDTLLVKMAQLNKRKATLDYMRKMDPKTRLGVRSYSGRRESPEYQYINFDPAKVSAEYERVDALIAEMQMALDKYNQTFEFDVEL